jgi:L-ascorbate metabolism protein UlaG (beta-lactamase superfamily)
MEQQNSNPTSIKYVGHSTVLLEMSGVKVLTDPVFRKRIWFLKRNGPHALDGIDLGSLDAVLLSHMHFDHMDYPSLNAIPRSVPIVAPQGGGKYLRRKVSHEIIELHEGESIEIKNISITATPSNHHSGFYWPFWYPSKVLSYILQGSQTVYFVGDTALFDGMGDLGREYNIDAALLPVWGYGPYIRGDHLSPTDAASALSMLSPRMAIPIHWGTLRPIGPWWKKMSFMKDPPHLFWKRAAECAPETNVCILNPGESTLVC